MALTPAEIGLTSQIGFDTSIADLIRQHTPTPLEQLYAWSENDEKVLQPALSVAIPDGEEAERLMNAIQVDLRRLGYMAFWSKRIAENGSRITDELAILKTTDSDAMVRLCHTGGENYGVSHADILQRLEAWRQICVFDVVGASHICVALQFTRLPERVCDFAVEVYHFCPDSVEQGVGLRHEKDDPGLFAAACGLCPELNFVAPKPEEKIAELLENLPPEQREAFSKMFANVAANSTSTDMGIRLLAHEIARTKYLFLWWD